MAVTPLSRRAAGTKDTVWVLGDQLGRCGAALAGADPTRDRILMVVSDRKLGSKRWHRQRLHLILTGMRRLAAELTADGFEVDVRRAPTLADGLESHRTQFAPPAVRAMEPASWEGLRTLGRLDVDLVRSNQFLCHRDEFAGWARTRKRLRLEDFYRWQRGRLDVLMDGGEPAGGRWNYDRENREPPPRDARDWPCPPRYELDGIDREVLASLPADLAGRPPEGLWPTSRAQALERLGWFVEEALPRYGPHQDAMLAAEPLLAHSLLSPALNLGLLLPGEVVAAAESAYRHGLAPIASVEGFVRQVLGWREYVWGFYWLLMPGYRAENALGADRPLPPAFERLGGTRMRCLAHTLDGVERRAWVHHIQRLMVLGNLALLAGVSPPALVDWMWRSFVDGAEWVMLPNVVGMALWADGGRMATKPYAAGGAYVNRMSDYCGGCEYDPRRRSGPGACPLTTLYWDFLARNADALVGNHRIARQLAAAKGRPDLDAIRARAAEVLTALDVGDL
jgi:deoxyribodipyrimidine photolyase-related protein